MRLDLVGTSAVSPFRLSKIAKELGIKTNSGAKFECRHLYIVSCHKEANSNELATLYSFLDHGIDEPQPLDFNPDLIITPRTGTQSPWGAKALSVMHEANLNFVEAIERGRVWQIDGVDAISVMEKLFDPMTESASTELAILNELFSHREPQSPSFLNPSNKASIKKANAEWGCALNDEEIEYLVNYAEESGHHFSDAELIMFGQVNSEHCRHKIFNGQWSIDGVAAKDSLFGLIKETHKTTPQNTLVAYKDNGSVVKGYEADMMYVGDDDAYFTCHEGSHLVIKVETHNHPTAISPFAGAATGSGGEIRDEGATGIGARPKAGMVGYTTSDLRIAGFNRPWELEQCTPDRIATPIDIMTEGPIGAASFNNEFGRPGLVGFFRTLELGSEAEYARWGYHKPIMIAGGIGTIRAQHIEKKIVKPGMKLVVLGGPGMRIGIGGGAASSATSEEHRKELDYASVQRSNPEMERRCQEVINRCRSLDQANPIVMIHDVGAGGLSNALPELVESYACGALINMEAIPIADSSLSPAEIWCNESQERYVLAINECDAERFVEICHRERCPVAIVGEATKEERIVVHSNTLGNVVDLPCRVLFQDPPKLKKDVVTYTQPEALAPTDNRALSKVVDDVLTLPAVASKSFLINIGDRSITGQVHRDQMVGPWQVPVSDCAITLLDYKGVSGEAMSVGERPLVAINNPAASVRLSVAEAITNLMAAPIESIEQIKLSANWMAASGKNDQDLALRQGVEAVSQFCCQCGLGIPVGKDSLSMLVNWDKDKSVTSPLSLVVTAFAPVKDVRNALTPQIENINSKLFLLDLSRFKARMGASAIGQTLASYDGESADIDANSLKAFMQFMIEAHKNKVLSAYHDVSDGGLLVTLAEMVFASRIGLNVDLSHFKHDARSVLFNEEVGAVIQVADAQQAQFAAMVDDFGLSGSLVEMASLRDDELLVIANQHQEIYKASRAQLQDTWHLTSWHMQRLRDEPKAADGEREAINISHDGLTIRWPQGLQRPAPMVNSHSAKVAILRDAGVNSHQEMAAAFMAAGFEAIDVPMSDLRDGKRELSGFQGLVACGGFSYGDVLGAGLGWAKSILHNERLRQQFSEFLNNDAHFALGVCNGCQMFSGLRSIIDGSEHWPDIYRNQSDQFEGRTVMVEVPQNNSVLFGGLAGAQLPVAVAHGEGRMDFTNAAKPMINENVVMQFTLNGSATEHYPFNPNGSPNGITGLSNRDGRINIVMPHPERNFRMLANSFIPNDWRDAEYGPWFEIFLAAKRFSA